MHACTYIYIYCRILFCSRKLRRAAVRFASTLTLHSMYFNYALFIQILISARFPSSFAWCRLSCSLVVRRNEPIFFRKRPFFRIVNDRQYCLWEFENVVRGVCARKSKNKIVLRLKGNNMIIFRTSVWKYLIIYTWCGSSYVLTAVGNTA